MHRWPVCSVRDLPRPEPRQRPGPAYGLVLLGDPPSFDEDDTDPHCCVKPLDAVALPSRAATAACRTRHGPTASCSAPMASRLRCLSTVRPGCLPGHRDYLIRHDSLGFDAGRLVRPLAPRERSRGLARPPTAVSDVHAARRSSGMAHPYPRGCISRRNSAILAYLATALRHLGVAIHELCLARPHRISTGCLVSQSVGMAPDHAATGRIRHGGYGSTSTKVAPQKCCWHSCRDCAKGRLSAPSLPDFPRVPLRRRTGRATFRDGAGRQCRGVAPRTVRPTNTATARMVVSLARVLGRRLKAAECGGNRHCHRDGRREIRRSRDPGTGAVHRCSPPPPPRKRCGGAARHR